MNMFQCVSTYLNLCLYMRKWKIYKIIIRQAALEYVDLPQVIPSVICPVKKCLISFFKHIYILILYNYFS